MIVLTFFIILAVLILAHELGHFLFAKWKGVKVLEFGFGFPPRLFGVKRGETLYSVNLLPLGGFVKIFGEGGPSYSGQPARLEDQPGGLESGSEKAFYSKSISSRALILSAGVLFNFLFAWAIFSANFMLGAPASLSNNSFTSIRNAEVAILAVQEKSPAEEAGLMPGDRLVSLRAGGESIGAIKITEVQEFINRHQGENLAVVYKRGGEEFSLSAVLDVSPGAGRGALGIVMDEIGLVTFPWHRAIWEGLKMSVFLAAAIGQVLFFLVKSAFLGAGGTVLEQVAGPVGIVSILGTAFDFGSVYLVQLVAVLSINLAVINILPFPALDGGRLLFLAAEAVKGSPINQKWENLAHSIGFALLIILMVIITYRDILKI